MSDEEKSIVVEGGKKKSFNKFLIIGIVALLIIVILAGISIVVGEKIINSRETPSYREKIVPVVATVGLEEFLVSTRDNQGVIKAQVELGLSTIEFAQVVEQHKGEIRDMISRILVGKSLSEANVSFSSGELQREIRDRLNSILEPYLDRKASFFGRKEPGEIAQVYFLNFLAK
ncbi:MAG: flagellar basal body-associated FliL family protein [Candidatus Wallbacteria bacterium]|nr:flagellar basal body-associated FliL family protein [Candidatus Wallbacteria bacterium]